MEKKPTGPPIPRHLAPVSPWSLRVPVDWVGPPACPHPMGPLGSQVAGGLSSPLRPGLTVLLVPLELPGPNTVYLALGVTSPWWWGDVPERCIRRRQPPRPAPSAGSPQSE